MIKTLSGNLAMLRTISSAQTARIGNSYSAKAVAERGGESGSYWYGALYLLTFIKTDWLGGGYFITMHQKRGARVFPIIFQGFISNSNMPSKLEDDITECMEYLGLIKSKTDKKGIVQKVAKKAKDMMMKATGVKTP